MTTKLYFCCFILFIISSISKVSAICGYESCHPVKSNAVNIHLVPHSHNDLGWLKTVEQYYYGARDDVHQAGVQYILDSVIDALGKNSERRFIQVETAFFWKWWLEQNGETRNKVKKLVNNGQLEFAGGGWSANDEAGVYYQTMIDQMSLGLKRLNDTFGECGRPKVGWQINAFGHSREVASIFAQMGYDGLFINRIDYEDFETRKANKSLEFVWRGSPDNLGGLTDIYTHILFRHYTAPPGLCFDVLCSDDSIVDDINSPDYNIDKKAEHFINNWVIPATQAYATNNILVPMGGDFMFQNANKNYKNIDKLIKYINKKSFNGSNYNIIYSTPSCYHTAVYNSANISNLDNALKTDDFFPYKSGDHKYWTGYFSSRPTGKAYSRYANNFLQVCKQMIALTNVTSLEEPRLEVLKEALGVFQHTNAITGTEKEVVAHDYIRLIHKGIVECEGVTNQTIFALSNSARMKFTTCPMLNISECARTEKEKNLIITVYNPLGRPVNKYVRLPIVDNTTEYIITDPSGTQIETQIMPIHPSVLKVPGRNSAAKFELTFKAANVPPLGFKAYYFEKSSKPRPPPITASPGPSQTRANVGLSVGTAYYYYTGYSGDDSPSQPYVFRPDPDVELKPVSKTYTFETYTGPYTTETHWVFTDWLSYTHRSFHDSSIGEFNYLVGPLPYINNKSIEVVVKFHSDLDYDDKVYMDTNGRESIERTRNYRPTYNVSIKESRSGNYYPVVTGMTLKNKNGTASVTVLTDRASGGASLEYQNMEFMIHRNTKRGGKVGEPLNEHAFGHRLVSRGSHYLMFGGTDHAQIKTLTPKEVSQQIYLDSWIFFASPNGNSFEQYSKGHPMEWSGLTKNVSLPRNVHILTLEPWGPESLLLRLENFVGKDDTWHSGTSTVNVKELFSTFDVMSMKETTLGGNQWLENSIPVRLNKQINAEKRTKQSNDNFKVTLKPMEIRTFVLTINYKK